MDFLREHQLSIMLFLSGICGVLTVMTLWAKFVPTRRKSILALMEMTAMLLLLFERFAYLYRGDASEFAFFMVRISNGMVFFLTILMPLLLTHYMRDLYRNEGGFAAVPRRLIVCEVLFIIGTVLIVVSQFTDLYYIFDAENTYHRSAGYLFSYLIPFLMVFIQESVILQYWKQLKKGLAATMAVCIALPAIAAVAQFFIYGISLTSMTLVIVVIVFYIYSLNVLGEEVGKARVREIEFYKEARKKEASLFEQTTEALANAIDAKDRYTHGHSTRVAMYSRQIAKEAGFSDEECSEVYFAALLHDVGKIGVRDEVINKTGRLTEEEFEHIKTHTVLGNQILSSIRQSPYLSDGAHYHHERYDGRGYPEGLAGEAIPVYARIIAVADAFDAMTSTRSYRDALPMTKVREEIENGMGKQFDPEFAKIMLHLTGRDYQGNPEESGSLRRLWPQSGKSADEQKS